MSCRGPQTPIPKQRADTGWRSRHDERQRSQSAYPRPPDRQKKKEPDRAIKCFSFVRKDIPSSLRQTHFMGWPPFMMQQPAPSAVAEPIG